MRRVPRALIRALAAAAILAAVPAAAAADWKWDVADARPGTSRVDSGSSASVILADWAWTRSIAINDTPDTGTVAAKTANDDWKWD